MILQLILHTAVIKTDALKRGLERINFDAALGGVRRDRDRSYTNERVFCSELQNITGILRVKGKNYGQYKTDKQCRMA